MANMQLKIQLYIESKLVWY